MSEHYDNAKKLNVSIKPSTRKNKKIDVFNKSGKKIASIGDLRYADYHLYRLTHGKEVANKRKSSYKKRHEKTRNKINSPSYFSDKILWS